MSVADPRPGTPAKLAFALLSLLAYGMAMLGAVGAIFATAIGSKAPPGSVMLLVFSPTILTFAVAGIAAWTWRRGYHGRALGLMVLAIAIVPASLLVITNLSAYF